MIRPMNCESDVRELRSHLAGSPLLGYAGALIFSESKHNTDAIRSVTIPVIVYYINTRVIPKF